MRLKRVNVNLDSGHWFLEDGLWSPAIAGGEGENEPGTGSGSSGPTFTQEDLNRVGAAEKAQGRQAALREVAEQLGMSVDDAKKFIDEARQRETEKLSEVERRERAAEERERKAQEREEQAAAREHRALVRDALIDAGVPRDEAGDYVVLVDVRQGATPEEVAASVAALKERRPRLFEASDGGGENHSPKPPDSVNRGKQPPPPKSKDAATQRARDRLLKRHPQLAKS